MVSHSIELPHAIRHSEFRFVKLGAEGQRLKAPIEIGWNIFDINELKAYIEKKADYGMRTKPVESTQR
jgi:hypothetical protein